MSLDKFHHAVQSARLAHAERDRVKFMEAIDEAKLAIAEHPRLTSRLTQAQDSFPTIHALQIVRQVCCDVPGFAPPNNL